MELTPESYTIYIPEFGFSLVSSTYIPTKQVSTAGGTTIVKCYGFSVYFNPFKEVITENVSSSTPQYPVQIDFKLIHDNEVVYSNTIP